MPDTTSHLRWDDLPMLVAIDRAGTLLGAAHALGVSHSTILRRLAAAERALSVALFSRRGGVLIATDAGRDVVARAGRIQRDVEALTRAAGGVDRALAGEVRVAAPLNLVTAIVVPALRPFLKSHPQIRVMLHAELEFSAMPRGEADVGLRVSMPVADGFDIRKVCDCRFGLYACRRLAGTAAAALRRGEPPGPGYVAFGEERLGLPEERWMRTLFWGEPPVLRTNAGSALVVAAQVGIGVAALPCYVGDRMPGLVRIALHSAEPSEGIFLVTRREQRRVARVRAVVDFLVRCIGEQRHLFSGEQLRGRPSTTT
jgi:DNA-binding transcriptional LysR family regulator